MASWILAAILGLTPIAPGVSVTGTMPDGDPTTALVAYRLEGVSGAVTVEASSYDFDVRLKIVQRAGEGEAAVVAEDDDSGVATNARLTFEAAPGVLYEVEVRPTVDDWGGEFSVVVAEKTEERNSEYQEAAEAEYWSDCLKRVASAAPALEEHVGAWTDSDGLASGVSNTAWLGTSDPFNLERLARCLHGTGAMSYLDGDAQGAVPLLRSALEIRESLRGAHPRLLSSLIDLGRALQAAERFEEALPYRERALQLSRERFGSTHLDTAIRLEDLANTWCRLDRPDIALPLRKEALGAIQQVRGESPYWEAFFTFRLADEYWHDEEWWEALPFISKAARILESNSFPADEHIVKFHDTAAGTFHEFGACEDEWFHLGKVVETTSAYYGPDSREHLDSLVRLGVALALGWRLSDSRPVLESALALAEKLDGPESPMAATCRYYLGTVYRGLGLYSSAIHTLIRAREIKMRIGAGLDSIAGVEHALGRAYLEMGEPGEALPHLEASVRGWSELDPSGSHRVAMAHQRVGEALHELGRRRESRAEKRIATEMLRRFPDPSEHPCVLAPP